jgi:hypothetical protein
MTTAAHLLMALAPVALLLAFLNHLFNSAL